LTFDLSRIGKIYVIGGGKAAQRQAEAIEDALGDLISEGHVNAKKGDSVRLKRIEITLAGHPIPDEDSVTGSRRIMEVCRKAKKGDIVFHSESGGGSALLTLPAPGVTLQDLQDVNRILYFECGASMWDTNAVRNMLVLLRSREPRQVGEATYVQVSTDERPLGFRIPVVGRDFTARQGLSAYDYATDVLHRYHCWDRMPEAVRRFLSARDPKYVPLTPEDWDRNPWYHFRVMGPEYMLEAARKKARELGINARVLVSSLSDVEARPAGEVLAYIAKEIEMMGRPLRSPAALLCGGELVVTVGESDGRGGRNQEFVLATAPRIAGSKRIVVASVDSDGADGPTDRAGGIVDGQTMERATEKGIDVFDEMARHNTCDVLCKLGDDIYTGIQGTNVQDLRVVYVGPRVK
jgi:glycerate-2-kinase